MFRVGRRIVGASCAMCLGPRPASFFSLWAFARPCASSPSMNLTSIGCVERRVPARRFRRWFRGRRQLRLRESNVPGATVGASCPARPRGFTSRPGLGRSCGTRSCAAISSVVGRWQLRLHDVRGMGAVRPAVSRDTVAFRLGTRGYSGVCVWTHDLSGGPASVHLLQPPCLLDRPAYYRMIYTPHVLHSQYTGTDRTEG